jgi:hypothetical protein
LGLEKGSQGLLTALEDVVKRLPRARAQSAP